MGTTCRNCRHFNKKDSRFGINTRGVCARLKQDDTGKPKKISYLRWIDDTCPDFEPKEEEKSPQDFKPEDNNNVNSGKK